MEIGVRSEILGRVTVWADTRIKTPHALPLTTEKLPRSNSKAAWNSGIHTLRIHQSTFILQRRMEIWQVSKFLLYWENPKHFFLASINWGQCYLLKIERLTTQSLGISSELKSTMRHITQFSNQRSWVLSAFKILYLQDVSFPLHNLPAGFKEIFGISMGRR